MKLIPEEVAIMRSVKELMQQRYNGPVKCHTQFICWTILEIVQGFDSRYYQTSLDVQMRDIGGIAERLYGFVELALIGNGTMGNFIERETRKFGRLYARWAGKFEAEARLAWLDRIIEMGEIK